MHKQSETVSINLEKELFDALTVLADTQDSEPTDWLRRIIYQELCYLEDRVDRQNRTIKGLRSSLRKFDEAMLLVE